MGKFPTLYAYAFVCVALAALLVAAEDLPPATQRIRPLLRVVEAIDAPDAVPRVLRSVGALIVGAAASGGGPPACVVEDGMLEWTQLRASTCLKELLSLEAAFVGSNGLSPLADGWGGVEIGITGVSSQNDSLAVAPTLGSGGTAGGVLSAVLGVRLSRVMLASEAMDHPVVGHAARRWLKPPGRMTRREEEASPRERRLAALAALLFGDAFCSDAAGLASSRAMHVLSMPADSEDWGGWDPATRQYTRPEGGGDASAVNGSGAPIQQAAREAAERQARQLAWLPPVASRVARRSAAGTLRDMIGPLHRPWQRAGATSLSRLLEPLVKPPASGGVVSCPPLDDVASVPSAASVRASRALTDGSVPLEAADSAFSGIRPAEAAREAAERRMVALAWAWSMVETRAFDVTLPGDGVSVSPGVAVKVEDPKERAAKRLAAKRQAEAKAKKEMEKRVAAAKRGQKVKPAQAKTKAKGKRGSKSGAEGSSKTKGAAAELKPMAEITVSDNALVPLLDLANTPPPGWAPAQAAPLAEPAAVEVGADGEATAGQGKGSGVRALAGAALAVEADAPLVAWASTPGAGGVSVPRSLAEAGYAGRGSDVAVKGRARAWVVLRVEAWRKAFGPATGDGEATRSRDTVPVWLAYGGDPRLAEARLLRDSHGRKTARRAPTAAALGTAGAASDAVSPSGELGSLLAGSRCAQEWWVHYGFVPGGHAAAIAAATPELRTAVEASEAATAELLRGAEEMAEKGAVSSRLQDAIAKAEQRRESRGGATGRKPQARGVTAMAHDNNETALAEALVLLDRHRRRLTRESAGSVWAGAVHPPADCAAVRLWVRHGFTEEDAKSDADPTMHTMSPHSALLRVTGLLPAMVPDGRAGSYKTPPNRDIVDVTAIVRAPPPQLLASLRTHVAEALRNDTAIQRAAAVAIAAGANVNVDTEPQHPHSSSSSSSSSAQAPAGSDSQPSFSSSRALAAAITARGGSADPVMDLSSRLGLPQRPVAPVPPGLLQAAAALAVTREEISEIGGPLAAASLLQIPVMDSETVKRLSSKRQPRSRKVGIRPSKSTRGAVEQQGRRGSHSDLRAMRAAIEERAAIAVRGLMQSTRDGAVAALRGLARLPNALTPGAQGAVHDLATLGLDQMPPPEASLGASVALRLAGFSIRPLGSGPVSAPADTSSASQDGDLSVHVEAATPAPEGDGLPPLESWPAGLGDDRGGLPPDLELLDPAMGNHSLTEAEALLPPDVRAVAHAHASALRALAAAAEGARVEADAAIEEFLAASQTEYNPNRKR